jgi:hypothetical protein
MLLALFPSIVVHYLWRLVAVFIPWFAGGVLYTRVHATLYELPKDHMWMWILVATVFTFGLSVVFIDVPKYRLGRVRNDYLIGWSLLITAGIVMVTLLAQMAPKGETLVLAVQLFAAGLVLPAAIAGLAYSS